MASRDSALPFLRRGTLVSCFITHHPFAPEGPKPFQMFSRLNICQPEGPTETKLPAASNFPQEGTRASISTLAPTLLPPEFPQQGPNSQSSSDWKFAAR